MLVEELTESTIDLLATTDGAVNSGPLPPCSLEPLERRLLHPLVLHLVVAPDARRRRRRRGELLHPLRVDHVRVVLRHPHARADAQLDDLPLQDLPPHLAAEVLLAHAAEAHLGEHVRRGHGAALLLLGLRRDPRDPAVDLPIRPISTITDCDLRRRAAWPTASARRWRSAQQAVAVLHLGDLDAEDAELPETRAQSTDVVRVAGGDDGRAELQRGRHDERIHMHGWTPASPGAEGHRHVAPGRPSNRRLRSRDRTAPGPRERRRGPRGTPRRAPGRARGPGPSPRGQPRGWRVPGRRARSARRRARAR